MNPTPWKLAGLSTALALTASAAFAQAPPCTGAMQATIERQRDRVEAAEDLVKARKAFLTSVSGMSPATMRAEHGRLSRLIDADRGRLRTGGTEPTALVQQRLRDNEARRDLLLDGVTRSMIDEKVNPARNPYVAQVQAAENDLRAQQQAYTNAVAACGGQQTARPSPTAPRPPQATPPDGRSVQPVSPAEAAALSEQFALRPDLPAAEVDGWASEYTDSYLIYRLIANDSAIFLQATSDRDGSIIHDWQNCRADRAQIVCDAKGEYRFFDDRVRYTGRVVAMRNNGVITARLRFDTVTVVSGTNLGIDPGEIVPLRYTKY